MARAIPMDGLIASGVRPPSEGAVLGSLMSTHRPAGESRHA